MSDQVTLDQISDFGDLIPPGHEFTARAKKIEVKSTKQKEDGSGGNKPFLQIGFEVLQHPQFEGIEFSKSYFLSITKGRNGKLYSRGVTELTGDLKALGHPLPSDYRYEMEPKQKDVQALAKVVMERIKPGVVPMIRFKSIAEVVQQKNPETDKWEDAYNDDGSKKMRAKYVILGAGKAQAKAAAEPQPAQPTQPTGQAPEEGEPQSPEDAINLL